MTLTTISYRECIDIELLYRQKWALIRAMKFKREMGNPKDADILEGLITYVDDIKDRVDQNSKIINSMEDKPK